MVLLKQTPSIVTAINEYRQYKISPPLTDNTTASNINPSLESPEQGKPISIPQLTKLAQALLKYEHEHNIPRFRLDGSVRATSFLIPKSASGPQPVPNTEYIALMARLRREEEQRTYHRMLNTGLTREAFAQHSLNSFTKLFPQSIAPISDQEADELTYADVNRQVALIINVLVSIICCSAAIWMATSRWSAPKRLAISMAGSLLVAVAEVVVYNGYLRRLKEAKEIEKSKQEKKDVIKTWVIDGKEKQKKAQKERGAVGSQAESQHINASSKSEQSGEVLRKRKVEKGKRNGQTSCQN
ncbi:MAG: hypothetical protein M1829_006748 [Trizodia sp. TS-e1964]|nr:MAG: hypothetical protein M1829_006748 [Trizodia sp. TS-e1964]